MEQFLFQSKGEKILIQVIQEKKVPFLFDQKINKEEIQLERTKLNSKLPELNRNKLENFTILISKKDKHVGQKRMRDREIIDTIFIGGLPNFDTSDIINPIEIKIEEANFFKKLQKYL